MYDEIVIKLKVTKYKEDFFCYLSSYLLDLGLQTSYLLTLFSGCMPSKLLILGKHFHSSFGSQIRSTIQTPICCHSNWVDQTPGSHTCCVQ